MASKNLSLKSFEWTDLVNPPEKDIDAIIEKYDFHELDREAIIEENQRARVDTYGNYLFVVLHFPKYDPKNRRYISNEFNLFISKKYLISFRYYSTSSVDTIFDRYEQGIHGHETPNPGYLLYDILDTMLDKMLRLVDRFGKDLRNLENNLFSDVGEHTISEIMIRKRNIIALKHMVGPQRQVLKMLELRMNAFFKDEIEVYFENLEDKVEKIYAEIQLLQENIDSMEDTLKSLFEMQTNNTIKYLTLFSAYMLPLTLITSFFGMNIESVPFRDHLIYASMIGTTIIMALIIYLLKRWKKL